MQPAALEVLVEGGDRAGGHEPAEDLAALVEAGLTRAKSVSNIMMKNMMDFMASRYKLEAGDSSDGVQTKTLKARFRSEMKHSICFALARGNALAMMSQGAHGICVSR